MKKCLLWFMNFSLQTTLQFREAYYKIILLIDHKMRGISFKQKHWLLEYLVFKYLKIFTLSWEAVSCHQKAPSQPRAAHLLCKDAAYNLETISIPIYHRFLSKFNPNLTLQKIYHWNFTIKSLALDELPYNFNQ